MKVKYIFPTFYFERLLMEKQTEDQAEIIVCFLKNHVFMLKQIMYKVVVSSYYYA